MGVTWFPTPTHTKGSATLTKINMAPPWAPTLVMRGNGVESGKSLGGSCGGRGTQLKGRPSAR